MNVLGKHHFGMSKASKSTVHSIMLTGDYSVNGPTGAKGTYVDKEVRDTGSFPYRVVWNSFIVLKRSRGMWLLTCKLQRFLNPSWKETEGSH